MRDLSRTAAASALARTAARAPSPGRARAGRLGLFHVAALVLLGERHRGVVVDGELAEVVVRASDVALALSYESQAVVLEREPVVVIRLVEVVQAVARGA